MTKQPTNYSPTLVFHCVHGFLEAVQTRGIHEIGCATLQRTTPYAQGMLERRVSFIQLTAHDHARDAILACSVYLKHGDFVGPDQLFTPPDEWRRQLERGERIRRARTTRLERVSDLRVLDAAYAIQPDLAIRFAAFPPGDPEDATNGS